MNPRKLLAAAAVVPFALSSLAMSGGESDPCRAYDPFAESSPVICEERNYFHCDNDPIKVQNAGWWWVSETWDTEEPGGSFSEGYGCANVDPTIVGWSSPDSPLDFSFVGTFDGPLDSLTITGFADKQLVARSGEGADVRVRVAVDGEHILPSDGARIVLRRSGDGPLGEYSVTVTNIGLLSPGEKSIEFAIGKVSAYDQVTWFYDATEAPSGITFNPLKPKGNIVRVPAAGF